MTGDTIEGEIGFILVQPKKPNPKNRRCHPPTVDVAARYCGGGGERSCNGYSASDGEPWYVWVGFRVGQLLLRAFSTTLGEKESNTSMSSARSEKRHVSEEFDFSWSKVCASARRQKAIQGAILGLAVGEALGLARQNLSRRAGLWLLGGGAAKYRVVPGVGICSLRLHSALQASQAILRSYQKNALFVRSLSRRTRWYLLFSTPFVPWKIWLAGWKLWLPLPEDAFGNAGLNTHLIPRNLLISTTLQGTGVRPEKWVEGAAQTIHKDPKVAEASTLVALAAQLASFVEPGQLDRKIHWSLLEEEVADHELSQMMDKLGELLHRGCSVSTAAKKMGWKNGIPEDPYASVLIAIYSWMRHPHRFRRTVEPAIRLGGDAATVGAIAAGLSAIHLGPHQIPPEWVKWLACWPHDRAWLKKLAARLTDWPHGAEDLHRAPPMPSRPIRQLVRNGILALVLGCNWLLKLPLRMLNPIF